MKAETKEKLELVHLVGYLPFKLKVLRENKSFRNKVFSIVGASEENVFTQNNGLALISIDRIKPILRPLSDLTKDENFDLYLELCDDLGVARCEHLLLALQDKSYYAFDISKLEILENFMYTNHFDWKYNLIEKGLAIDLNTLSN